MPVLDTLTPCVRPVGALSQPLLGQTLDSQGPVAQPCLHSIPGFWIPGGRRPLRSEPLSSLSTGRDPPGGPSGEHWPQFLGSLGRAPGEGVRVGIHLILAHPRPRGLRLPPSPVPDPGHSPTDVCTRCPARLLGRAWASLGLLDAGDSTMGG